MKTKSPPKPLVIKHKEITGKVIGISEEKDKSNLKLLLNNSNLEITAKRDNYQLGDDIEMDVNFEVNKISKKK